MLRLARNLSLLTYRSICLTASLVSKNNSGHLEDQILRESETLSLLAKNPTIRAQFSSNLPKRITQSLSITNGSPIEIKSSVLKSLMRKENVTVKVLEETGGLPIVLVEPVHGSKSSSHKEKLLKLRTNIDDNMIGIKVKQAAELVARGHEVSINVRLPNQQLRQINESPALSEDQKLAMKKKLYDSSIQRFTEAFKGCSSKNPKLLQSADLKEFTIVLPPGK